MDNQTRTTLLHKANSIAFYLEKIEQHSHELVIKEMAGNAQMIVNDMTILLAFPTVVEVPDDV